MTFEIGYVIAAIDWIVGIAVVIMTWIAASRLKGGTLYWFALFFMITGVLFVVHASVELAGLGEGLYAVTALIATFLLAFTMVIIDITTKMLGVKA